MPKGWDGYSPEFEDAYDRRFADKVRNETIFNEWVKIYNEWINQTTRKGEPERQITKAQTKSLAYEAKQEGITNFAMEEKIKYGEAKRTVWRDKLTGKFSRSPYKEESE